MKTAHILTFALLGLLWSAQAHAETVTTKVLFYHAVTDPVTGEPCGGAFNVTQSTATEAWLLFDNTERNARDDQEYWPEGFTFIEPGEGGFIEVDLDWSPGNIALGVPSGLQSEYILRVGWNDGDVLSSSREQVEVGPHRIDSPLRRYVTRDGWTTVNPGSDYAQHGVILCNREPGPVSTFLAFPDLQPGSIFLSWQQPGGLGEMRDWRETEVYINDTPSLNGAELVDRQVVWGFTSTTLQGLTCGDYYVCYRNFDDYGAVTESCDGMFTVEDVCDPDRDEDTVPDDVDNCPDTPNADQADADMDDAGDACDVCPDDADDDSDMDDVCADVDNCPEVFNPEQEDRDDDGQGDACDEDGGDDVGVDPDAGDMGDTSVGDDTGGDSDAGGMDDAGGDATDAASDASDASDTTDVGDDSDSDGMSDGGDDSDARDDGGSDVGGVGDANDDSGVSDAGDDSDSSDMGDTGPGDDVGGMNDTDGMTDAANADSATPQDTHEDTEPSADAEHDISEDSALPDVPSEDADPPMDTDINDADSATDASNDLDANGADIGDADSTTDTSDDSGDADDVMNNDGTTSVDSNNTEDVINNDTTANDAASNPDSNADAGSDAAQEDASTTPDSGSGSGGPGSGCAVNPAKHNGAPLFLALLLAALWVRARRR